MAIIVKTAQPRALLDAIKKAIDNGSIETWQYDGDGDFTHSPTQWRHKAWLRPSTSAGKLLLITVSPANTHMSRVVYAVFHGRFIEMLLTHFDTQFDDAVATALPSNGDSVGA